MRKVITSIAIIGVLVWAGIAGAQEENRPPAAAEVMPAPAEHHCEHEAMKPPLMGIPNLTDAQREQIRALRLKHLKEVLPVESELRVKKLELAGLWDAEKLDTKAIVAKVKEIGELRNKLELARVQHKIEVYKLLTPEQRKLWRGGGGIGRGMMRRMRRGFPGGCHGQEGPRPGAMPCCPER